MARIEKTWGGEEREYVQDVAIGPNRGIYVVGDTYSFRPGACDAFILKYDSDGKPIWQKTWGGNGEEWGRSVAVHLDGSIYVVGETSSFKASGGLDAFVLRYDRHGQLRWQRTWGSNAMDTALDVAVTPEGNICVVGEITSLQVAGRCDAFILNYDPAGRLRWQKVWGGKNFEDAIGVAAVDKDILVVGTTTSSSPRILRDARGKSSTPTGVETKLSQPDYTIFGIVNTPNGIERTITGNPSKGNSDAYLICLR